MTPPLHLVDDAVEEILLRLPPDDPASLVRAAAVCRSCIGKPLVDDAAYFVSEFGNTIVRYDLVGRGLTVIDLPEALRVIDLKTLLPAVQNKLRNPPYSSGFADGANTIFVTVKDGVYTVDLESLRTKKVSERDDIYNSFPYMCFYTYAVFVSFSYLFSVIRWVILICSDGGKKPIQSDV
ncbi:hypothetical protein QOZ80_7BG0585300 [Eleusine coracana subsp. coracana]|nr:hypothetical protein QOZ80_7BG0585300 [Eleusine coracana subsp. coracana]